MKKNSSTKSRLLWDGLLYALSFLLPVVIMLAISKSQGFYPFGEKSMLIMDMKGQYVEFFASLRNIIGGDDSLFFSWSRSMGGNYMGLFAYYLSSPLSFITLFFSLEKLPLAIWLLTLLKIGLCGLSFLLFGNYLWNQSQDENNKAKGVLLLLAVCYALISYNMVYSLCLMWLDGVILLPLVCLGVEKLLDRKRGIFYIIALTALFISNYYTAYMVGVFTAIYFIFRMFSRVRRENIKECLEQTGQFTVCTLLAFGLSAPLILPMVKEFMAGKIGTQPYIPDATINFPVVQLLGKLKNGVYDSITNSGLPAIYCGILPLILALLFFLHKRIQWREKAGALLILILLVCSFTLVKLDIMWHVFRSPTWFPYRYAFVFSFFILYLACRSVCVIETENSGIMYRAAVLVILPIICVEMGMNGNALISGLDGEFYYGSINEYESFINKAKPLVDSIEEQDDSFYRINQGFEYSKNDSMLLGYHGMTHYSSTYNQAVNTLTKKFGIAQAHFWNSGYGSTPLLDSLFAVKYIMEDGIVPGSYELTSQSEGAAAYRNPFSLPIVYSAPVVHSMPEFENSNPFVNQNTLLNSIAGKEEAYFTDLAYTQEDQEGSWSFTFTAASANPVYLHMRGDTQSWTDIYVNDNWVGNCFSNETNCNLYLGTFAEGQQVVVNCIPQGAINLTEVYLGQLNLEILSATLAELQAGGMQIESHQGGTLNGTIQVGENQKIMTSIPYEEGWNVEIDGKEADIQKYADGFILVEAESGTHDIHFYYVLPGFWPGVFSCVLSIVLIAVYSCCRKGKVLKG